MTDTLKPHESHDEVALVSRIRGSQNSETVVQTTLRTDDRVIARVTDGIYRQPGSALRELISNSYDADATRVVIKTDPPRFERLFIEDNGHGMTPETLAHMLFHIGGSAKRSDVGSRLGIAAESDPLRSPNGRRLIGKIGIGLFSVSQLTHSFQIITKVKDDDFRTVATVALRQYSEDAVVIEHDRERQYESGKVKIWRERASDTEKHGTTIVLTNIRVQARDTLRSRDVWSAIQQDESNPESARKTIEPPKYHIGRVDSSGELLRHAPGGCLSSLPWEQLDSPADAFRKLVNCVWQEIQDSNPNPQLERTFDYYLRMIWQVSLASPLPYVNEHPFDQKLSDRVPTFLLSNKIKGIAQFVEADQDKTIRARMGLKDTADHVGTFEVFFDDLQLFRPIRFEELPTTNHALKHPLIFVGKCREEFPKIPRELSGGPLAFEAYLFWSPKIAPTEHQGSLIRIHGSSGTLFDSTFMRYQVSEQTRLRQITCEIFVSEGLDSALNIDRESFNNAHPHCVYLTKWLHSALRQLATAQKRIASETREETRVADAVIAASEIQRVALDAWVSETEDPASRPPSVEFSSTGKRAESIGDAYVFPRSAVVTDTPRRRTAQAQTRSVLLEEKLKGIIQVLASFELLDGLSASRQARLLRAIYRILGAKSE